jgi:uncharacterized RDD family membrane protein YckC
MQAPTKVIGRRIVAFLIDLLILAVIVAGAWFALTSQQSGSCPAGGGGINIGDNCRGFYSGDDGKRAAWFAIIFVAWLVLFVIVPGLKGTSPGKSAVGIRVVDERGYPPGIGRSLVRALLFWLLEGALIGVIVAAVSQRNQRIGDMVAKTLVVDKDAVGAIAEGGRQPAFAAPGGAQFGPPPTGQPPAQAQPPQAQPQQAQPPQAQPQQAQPQPPQAQPPQAQPQPQQAQPQPQQAHKADWYPDPQGQARLRYWDGQRWTEHTSQ